ncbi:MAG: hypothetical protein ABIK73_06720 [candidate division WOR-3 bacterium]
MAKLTVANVIALTDNIGYTYKKFAEAIGNTNTANTLLGNMQANLTRIVNFDDPEKQRYIQDSYLEVIENVVATQPLVSYFRPIIGALHLNLGESVSNFMLDNKATTRLCPEFALISNACGYSVEPTLVFPPALRLASYIKDNPEGADFTDGVNIDKSVFGPANIEVVVVAKGNGDMDVEVSGVDEFGRDNTWTATIPANSPQGTRIDLENANGLRCYDVTGIEVSGGTSGDEFHVYTKADRTITP